MSISSPFSSNARLTLTSQRKLLLPISTVICCSPTTRSPTGSLVFIYPREVLLYAILQLSLLEITSSASSHDMPMGTSRIKLRCICPSVLKNKGFAIIIIVMITMPTNMITNIGIPFFMFYTMYSGINEKQSSPELKIAGFWAFSATGETDFELFRNTTNGAEYAQGTPL